MPSQVRVESRSEQYGFVTRGDFGQAGRMKMKLIYCLAPVLMVAGCSKTETAAPTPPAAAAAPAPAAPAAPPAPTAPVAPAASATPVAPVAPAALATPAIPAASEQVAASVPVIPPPAAPPAPTAPIVVPTTPTVPATPTAAVPAPTAPSAFSQAAALLDQGAKVLGDSAATAAAVPALPAAFGGPVPAALAALPAEQVKQGLKDVLSQGVEKAVGSLGTTGGFATNPALKIAMPEKLQLADKALRSMGQAKLADDLVSTMNKAAEQAMPTAKDLLVGSVNKLSVDEAKQILSGSGDVATQYLKAKAGPDLKQKLLPIVQANTAKYGATAAYKQVQEKANLAGGLFGTKVPDFDLDGYVTDQTLEGVFKLVGAEEKRIQQNPSARSTAALKAVYGALQK